MTWVVNILNFMQYTALFIDVIINIFLFSDLINMEIITK